MPKTGEECRATGSYHGTCKQRHQRVITLVVNEVFPPCGEKLPDRQCPEIVDWTFMPDRKH